MGRIPRTVLDEAYQAAEWLQGADTSVLTHERRTTQSSPGSPSPGPASPGSPSPGPASPGLREFTAEEAEALTVGCEVPSPLEAQNFRGCGTYLKQTFRLFEDGLSKEEIQEVNGCGDLVDLIKNKLKAAKKRRCGKK